MRRGPRFVHWSGVLTGLVVVLVFGCPRQLSDEGEIAVCSGDPADTQRCTDRCGEIVAPYRQPLPVPTETVDATCRRFNDQIGCACLAPLAGRPVDESGDVVVALDRGDFFISDTGCGAIGRPGDCLHDPAAFPGCAADTESGDAVCAIVCAALDDARRDDADGRDDIEVVRVICDGGCECAVDVGGVCTVVFGDDPGLPDEQGVTPFAFSDAAGCP